MCANCGNGHAGSIDQTVISDSKCAPCPHVHVSGATGHGSAARVSQLFSPDDSPTSAKIRRLRLRFGWPAP